MIRLRIITTIILISTFKIVFSQIDSIKLIEIATKNHNIQYDKLVQKYSNIQQLVDTNEFRFLYYLKYKNNDFSYFDLNNIEKDFINYYQKYKYQNVVELGLKILEKDPTDLKTLYQTSVCLSKINKPDSAKLLLNRYLVLKQIIMQYGNGKTIETPYNITKIGDEYGILAETGHMFFNRKTKKTEIEIIDTWEIFNSDLKEFYFLHFRFYKAYTVQK